MIEYKYVLTVVGLILFFIIFYNKNKKKQIIEKCISNELKKNGVVTKTYIEMSFNGGHAIDYVRDKIIKKAIKKIEVEGGEEIYYTEKDLVKKVSNIMAENIYIDLNVLTKYWTLKRIKYYAILMETILSIGENKIIKISDGSETIFYINDKGLNKVRDIFMSEVVINNDKMYDVIGHQPTGIIITVVREALGDLYDDWYLYQQRGNQIVWFKGTLIRKVSKIEDDIVDKEIIRKRLTDVSEELLEPIMERSLNIIKEVLGEDKYTKINCEEKRIWVKSDVLRRVKDLSKKEVIKRADFIKLVNNSKYMQIIMNHAMKNIDELKKFIYLSDYDLWLNDKYVEKYRCRKCKKIYFNMREYGPDKYCVSCLNDIHRQEDEDEKNGKTVKRYVDAPPPGLKIKI